ncbi:hypothetical protein A2318_02160 [Candidatus Uhrbacteria bacterium RIFOXYB2_FULL_45_11]|uniref:Uncharacterized protein n=1 Tax=Candidatus Uhrbacteria bacterium RIFOXYB2_FULL_45_11 TaxID=1802421 RepID=A0A1F7W797_9BACT|nr:MAG: hypothetical protein A2318_02160 [Candidatus Uhrbacteria bacterium RIFOXYB2_FULL_45_11]
MAIDQIILHIPKDALLRILKEELVKARTALPSPHLVYRTGFSFTEKMILRDIVPSELETSTQELNTLERTGAELAIHHALKLAIEGDLFLENISGLIRFAHIAMKRCKIPFERFRIEPSALHKRECAYWRARGIRYAKHLHMCGGVRESMEARTWYLHEIRLAMRMGMLEKKEIGLDPALHHFSVLRLFHELTDLHATACRLERGSKTRYTLTQRYIYLVRIISADFEEYAE